LQSEQFDYVVVRTQGFEAPATGGELSVGLVYDGVAANWFEVFAGKNLELTMRGVSDIRVCVIVGVCWIISDALSARRLLPEDTTELCA